MPRLDGLQAARALSQMPQPPAVLFVTAYDEHALDAFDAQAVDYLLKPVRLDRLQTALGKAQRLSGSQTASLGQLLHDSAAVRETVCAHTPSGLQLIEVDRIRYFLADQKYVEAATDQGRWLLDDALKDLEQEFAPAFLRVHRNALVALAYVRGLVRDGDGYQHVQLQGVDRQIAVSRRHLPGVRQVLKQSG
jgi:two-component system response regulator AlgR